MQKYNNPLVGKMIFSKRSGISRPLMKGVRNVMAHEYFDVDLKTICKTVT